VRFPLAIVRRSTLDRLRRDDSALYASAVGGLDAAERRTRALESEQDRLRAENARYRRELDALKTWAERVSAAATDAAGAAEEAEAKTAEMELFIDYLGVRNRLEDWQVGRQLVREA
jgi:chromosome segregation ATPase